MNRLFAALTGLAALSCATPSENVDPAAQADVPAVARDDNQFALDLYAQLRGQQGNLFFSPYSISTALAMTRAGARGDTAAEMDKVMHFALPQDKLNPAFGALIHQVNGDPANTKRGYQLNTANALWAQKGYEFKPEFLKITKDDYEAGLNEVDFKHRGRTGPADDQRLGREADAGQDQGPAPPGRPDRGHAAGADQCDLLQGRLGQPVQEGSDQGPRRFISPRTSRRTSPLMHQTGEYGYLDGGSFQALEMPYGGNDLSMVVLLPKKIDGLADLEKELTADKLAGWVGKLHRQKVIVSLPKFKTEQRVSLKQTLSDMGMKLAFLDDKADLSGVAGEPHDLHISDVIHKAFIDVNEEGTEAAAATAVAVATASAVRVPQPTPEFRADHPFLFLIRDTRNDSILFLGRLAEPAK